VLAGAELVAEHDALVGDELLQRRQPEVVVALAVVALATLPRGGDLVGEPAGPLLPREVAALAEHHGHGKGLRLPWGPEHRAGVVAGDSRQRVEIGRPHAGSR